MQAVSSKKPIFSPEGEVLGLIGVSIEIPVQYIDTKQVINRIKKIGVTEREAECLYYFGKGKSAKESANILNMSHRTFDNHINNVRLKLNIIRRSQLFEFINEIIYAEL